MQRLPVATRQVHAFSFRRCAANIDTLLFHISHPSLYIRMGPYTVPYTSPESPADFPNRFQPMAMGPPARPNNLLRSRVRIHSCPQRAAAPASAQALTPAAHPHAQRHIPPAPQRALAHMYARRLCHRQAPAPGPPPQLLHFKGNTPRLGGAHDFAASLRAPHFHTNLYHQSARPRGIIINILHISML